MNFRHALAVAAITTMVSTGHLPSAQAQSGTVTVTSAGGTYQIQTNYVITAPLIVGGQYTYDYNLTLLPTAGSAPGNVSLLTFSFSGNPTFTSATPAGFGPPTNPIINNTATGYFVFFSYPGLTASNPSAQIDFSAAQGPTGTLSLGTSSNAGDASATAGLPGPVAAPEPSTLVSLALLGTCLGLGIVARKRKMTA